MDCRVLLTVSTLLEVRKLCWREFAVSLAHFSGGGGYRMRRPFGSTARAQHKGQYARDDSHTSHAIMIIIIMPAKQVFRLSRNVG